MTRHMLVSWFAVVLLTPATVHAYPSYGPTSPRYDEANDYDCSDCHISYGGGGDCSSWPCFNPFGRRYWGAGWTGTVQGEDTDGDGANNAAELPSYGNASYPTGTGSPGFPEQAAAAGCDMELCAKFGVSACANNVVCFGTRNTFRGGSCSNNGQCGSNDCSGGQCLYNWFSFSFGCAAGTSGTTSGGGTWACCPSGYSWNGSSCVDINECVSGNDCCVSGSGGCAATATCNNTTGSYTCDCPDGYGGNGRTSGSRCTACPPGTTTFGTSTTCTNIDECALAPCGPGTCSEVPLASWVAPGYTCACNSGYEQTDTPTRACRDIDECARGTDDCTPEPAATCTNTDGSFNCACNTPAFVGTTGRDCVDYDECMDPTYTGLCSSVATCVNGYGTWECICNPGFEGDGFTCVDIDECMRDTDDCDVNATCMNTIGAFTCTCNSGYEGTGVTCRDINECVAGTGGCGLTEVCVNQIGAPNTCVCLPGYTRATPDAECALHCGDGARGQGEACDDGNTADGDGCSASCAIESGWACREPTTNGTSTCMETCGDGLIDPVEECDDGAANSDTTPDACRTTCVRAHCGDDVLDTGEACDLGNNNSDTAVDGCRTTCDEAYCGDGVIDTGEVCDPGGGVPGASVAGTCTTLCVADAGIDPNDPPQLTGGACACRAVGSSSSSGFSAVLIGIAIALALRVRRRRR